MAFTREQRAAYNEGQRRKERDLVIPEIVDPARRRACEADDRLFLQTYFAERFCDAWTPDRNRILDQIAYLVRHGGDKAQAAPRGGGKTSVAEGRVGVKSILTGELRFPLIVAATGPDAERLLSNIKIEYETNDALAEDYPEVCECVRALEGAPQRCNMQTVLGERTFMRWSGNYVQFPKVHVTWCPVCYAPGRQSKAGWRCSRRRCGHKFKPGLSKASGAILMTRGLDAAIRGIRVGHQRPDFVLIDDPETRESAASEAQTDKRAQTIDNDIGGLGGPRKRVSRLMLTTIQNARCLSARYTDMALKPSWDGERMALVLRWPDAKSEWEQYIELRHDAMREGDKTASKAHEFYLANRKKMDAGVAVSNEFRFDPEIEVSTIQFVHNEAADKGWDYVFSELQNDPPDDSISDENRLTPAKVRGAHKEYFGRVAGVARGFVPDGVQALTAFIDVQERTLYYEIVAWYEGRRQHIVDYGNFGDPTIKDRLGVEESIKANLRDLHEAWLKNPCCGNDGAVPFHKILVDSGHEAPIVYQMVREFGGVWQAAKGDGKYKHPKASGSGKILRPTPDPLYESSIDRLRVVLFDATWWGHRCHDSFTVRPADSPEGCVTIFGKEAREHVEFAEQVCAQEWRVTFKEGKGETAEWVTIRHDNHYFDTHVGNQVAASWLGLSVTKRVERPKIKMSDLQRSKR